MGGGPVSDRVKRTAPLLAVRERALDERRGAFAAAVGAAARSRAAAASAHEMWEARAIRVGAMGHATVAEHAEARMHVESLRKGALRAAEIAVEAAKAERVAREAMIAAERELKKIETWRDGMLEDQRVEGARAERRATDELAARAHRVRR